MSNTLRPEGLDQCIAHMRSILQSGGMSAFSLKVESIDEDCDEIQIGDTGYSIERGAQITIPTINGPTKVLGYRAVKWVTHYANSRHQPPEQEDVTLMETQSLFAACFAVRLDMLKEEMGAAAGEPLLPDLKEDV